MLAIEIHEQACRGCRMCIDICPTQVLDFDDKHAKARVTLLADCIGCLSCGFLCPSGAIRHAGLHAVKNFYRDIEFSRRMEHYL